MPYCGSVCANRLYVPPYSVETEMMLSPARVTLSTEYATAAWPEAVAQAARPPSSAVTRCSNTSQVGFMMRV